ncbi:MAG TPA: type II toxin-antitoxin system VapB family antitoxin [Myxococcota bacterium]|nr:type II toxin-antitoxin system VapB family antitoxin [Myxococcota bacterium]HOA13810.1 type II toxin-antitoxin system VapB family antitoxin [Myxococcota bacterium]HOC98397.1 type II toxin-antitoxin system VapB family antitoxin [Myxococcota bacterium]HOH76913.1 type II toxin-antitoxin system VapB family antitoxin [Myxococcota bacterium]HPV03100.1 type II toxin-antitoxin system VapB family antitoxin [Myxococcota bacterium]
MATNLALDDELIEAVKSAGGHKTKKAAVTAALLEYLKVRERMKIIELAGTVDFDPNYDYKTARRSKQA